MRALVYLIRHGETQWNREGRYQGFRDTDLSDKGRAQATALGKALSGVDFTRAICSPMKRARDTARLILAEQNPELHLEEVDGFKEISHGTWEGRLAEELRAEDPDFLKVWETTPEKVKWPEGESLQDVADRVLPAWNTLVESLRDGDRLALVCHDAILKTIFSHLKETGLESIWSYPQGPTACNQVEVLDQGQSIKVLAMNGQDHLTGELAPAVHKAL